MAHNNRTSVGPSTTTTTTPLPEYLQQQQQQPHADDDHHEETDPLLLPPSRGRANYVTNSGTFAWKNTAMIIASDRTNDDHHDHDGKGWGWMFPMASSSNRQHDNNNNNNNNLPASSSTGGVSSLTSWRDSFTSTWRSWASSWRPTVLVGTRPLSKTLAVVLLLLLGACTISYVHRQYYTQTALQRRDNPADHVNFVQALRALQERIQGKVILWPSDNYVDDHNNNFPQKACWVWNQCTVDDPPPAVIIQVANEDDVSIVVPYLHMLQRNFSVPFRIRSGGYSYAGWSTVSHGIVLSLERLNNVQLFIDDDNTNNNRRRTTATVSVGPGVRARDVLHQILLPHGYGSVLSIAPDVAYGGFVLGGGNGWLTRRYGLGMDQLASASVVLATGQIVTATAASNQPQQDQQYADLFWALCGAGQGNFGVVTQFNLTYYPVQDEMYLLQGSLPVKEAATFMANFGQLAVPRQAGALFANHVDFSIAEVDYPVSVMLWWNPDRHVIPNQGDDDIIAQEDANSNSNNDVATRIATGRNFWNATLHQLLPAHVVQNNFKGAVVSWYNTSMYKVSEDQGYRVQSWNGFLYPKQNTADTWRYIWSHLWNVYQESEYADIAIDYFGGESAFHDVPSNATAFPWRDAVYNIRLTLFMPVSMGQEAFESQIALYDSQWVFVEPYLTGSYVNYAQATLNHDREGFAKTLYGDNLARLQKVKQKYDPHDVFNHPQSIPPLPNKR